MWSDSPFHALESRGSGHALATDACIIDDMVELCCTEKSYCLYVEGRRTQRRPLRQHDQDSALTIREVRYPRSRCEREAA